MRYRVRETGEVLTYDQIKMRRQAHGATPKEALWDQKMYDFLGVDPVKETPRPAVDPLTHTVLDRGVVVSPEGPAQAWEVQTRPHELVLQSMLSRLKGEREKRLNAGTTVVMSDGRGIKVATDSVGLARLHSVVLSLEERIDWVAGDTVYTLNASEFRDVQGKASEYIQGCYSRYVALATELSWAQEPHTVDITAGWPE